MSERFPGGVISATPVVPTPSSAPGIWTLDQQEQAQAAGTWPYGGPFNYIEDVFSTYLYTGNGSTQTITNGIDLAGKGGLVWGKSRSNPEWHSINDTVRGPNKTIQPNNTNAESSSDLTAFTSSGFSLGYITGSINGPGQTEVSWTFRKQPKFFDVVTYTGDGVAGRTVAHSLGSVPGCVIVKCTSTTGDWFVYHRGTNGGTNPEQYFTNLNLTSAQTASSAAWNNTAPTSTNFTLGSGIGVNGNGRTYVAYIFAHNAGGFGLTGTDNVISCGSYTDGAGVSVNLGYEPQWLLVKAASTTSGWVLMDTMRGLTMTDDRYLQAQLVDAEGNFGLAYWQPTATGFYTPAAAVSPGTTMIYIAIRRGPMKVPTDGTTVFSPIVANATQGTAQTTSFPIDFQLKTLTTGGQNPTVDDRLRGNSSTSTGSGRYLTTNTSSQESTAVATTQAWDNTGFQIPSYYASSSAIFWSFRRAPQFSDVVCWTAGSNANARITHNLTTAPQLIFVKQRNVSNNAWFCYSASLGIDKYLFLNFSDPSTNLSGAWGSSPPTSTDFGIKETALTTSGSTQVAYLFATCPGVSKVGSYTGNGSTQTINCGFTGGARFVLIKCTSATGDWYVYDTARGMTTLTDPYLLLNSTTYSATLGSVTTVTTGFALNAAILADINTNGASYIFLAIA